MDRNKQEVKYQLLLLQFTHRVANRLCIYCGEVQVIGACAPCLEEQRLKRIAKYGVDYLAEECDNG